MDTFAVIEFLVDKTVALISKKWITTDVVNGNELTCFWPPNNVSQRCKKEEIPDPDLWTKYEVKVLAYTDNYAQGIRWARTAEVTSNFDTEPEEENLRKRKKFSRLMGDDNEDERESKSVKTKRKITSAAACSRKLVLPKPPDFCPVLKDLCNVGWQEQVPKCIRDAANVSQVRAPPQKSSCEGAGQDPGQVPIPQKSSCAGAGQDPGQVPIPQKSSCTGAGQDPGQVPTPQRSNSAGPGQDDGHYASDGQVSTPSNADSTRHRSEENHAIRRPTVTSFQVSVMAKLDTIIENQQEQNLLLRQIAASSLSSGSGDALDELIPSKMDSIEELLEFEEKLQDTEFKKKMVNLLSITGGRKLTDTVRKIMRKLATNKVWSMMSFRGRKGKRPFAELRTCRIILRATARIFKKSKEQEIEEAIAEVLRNAPHRPGGLKFTPKSKQSDQERVRTAHDETDTD